MLGQTALLLVRSDGPARLRGRRVTAADVAVIAATAASYYAGARIGLLPALVRGQVTPFWPPSGIAVFCLIVFGLRGLPGIAIAAFAVNAPLGPTLPAAFAIAFGNTLVPLAVVLMLRALKVSLDLARVRDGVVFVVVAVAGMTVSATWGTAILRMSGGVTAAQTWSTWWVWWAGDAMGVLVVAPVLLHLIRMWPWRFVAPGRAVEGVLLLASVAVVTRYVVVAGSPAGLLICPLLVWAAFRFRQLGVALVALEVSVLASAAAARGHGAFARGDLMHSMLVLQLFNASIVLTGLLLAAAITQLEDSRHDLGVANLLLSQKVEQRSAELDRDRNRIAVLADRYRIATQLHDTVLQRLFGIGTALESAAASADPAGGDRLERLVDELDATVNELAVAMYHVEDDLPAASFRDAVDHVIVASTKPFGLRPPALVLTGDGEQVPLALRTQLLAALHDSLSDIAGQPGIRQVNVAVAIDPDGIGLAITADHDPQGVIEPGAGIERAAGRARRLGGTCEWHAADRQSTLTLQIPTA